MPTFLLCAYDQFDSASRVPVLSTSVTKNPKITKSLRAVIEVQGESQELMLKKVAFARNFTEKHQRSRAAYCIPRIELPDAVISQNEIVFCEGQVVGNDDVQYTPLHVYIVDVFTQSEAEAIWGDEVEFCLNETRYPFEKLGRRAECDVEIDFLRDWLIQCHKMFGESQSCESIAHESIETEIETEKKEQNPEKPKTWLRDLMVNILNRYSLYGKTLTPETIVAKVNALSRYSLTLDEYLILEEEIPFDTISDTFRDIALFTLVRCVPVKQRQALFVLSKIMKIAYKDIDPTRTNQILKEVAKDYAEYLKLEIPKPKRATKTSAPKNLQ